MRVRAASIERVGPRPTLSAEQTALVEAWVAALRDGSRLQGKDRLRTHDGFCCLGVACDVVNPDGWFELSGVHGWLWGREELKALRQEGESLGETASNETRGRLDLPESVRELLGVVGVEAGTSRDGRPTRFENLLAMANDSEEPYTEIANAIERVMLSE